MNLHVLFFPTETVDPDGATFPVASVPLILDDEIQYRCAGFIQAEIERYAEELNELKPRQAKASDDENSASDDGASPVKPAKSKVKTTRKEAAIGKAEF